MITLVHLTTSKDWCNLYTSIANYGQAIPRSERRRLLNEHIRMQVYVIASLTIIVIFSISCLNFFHDLYFYQYTGLCRF